MIVVSIYGGLGSQMDQYSFYLAIKKAYPDVNVKVEILNIFKPQHNGYELGRVFGINAPEATLNEVATLSDLCPWNLKHAKFFHYLYSIRRRICGKKSSWINPDDPSAYYPEIFNLNPLQDWLLFGNWGNEAYRKDINTEIFETFKFCDLSEQKNIQIAGIIASCNSVSLHVRHGDYMQYGMPIMPLGYYKKAVEIICSEVEKPEFFIFSDDIEFVKSEFVFLPNYYIIDWNKGENCYRDMQLMSLCKHNIIANSTFSYWGARLNQNDEAIKIAPKYHVPICKHTFGEKMPGWTILDNKILNDY